MNFKASLLAISIAGTLSALAPSTASAQDQVWTGDRRFLNGKGYQAGNFELHPGLAAEFGYDSNFLRRSDEEAPIDALRLNVVPSFSINSVRDPASTTPPDYHLRAGAVANYTKLFALSEDGGAFDGPGLIGGVLDFNLVILPKRPWSVVLFGNVGRDITPSNIGITSGSFNRIQGGGGGELVWTPGGGLLDWRLGYNFNGTLFEEDRFDDLSNTRHEINTRGRWRFLPRTAFLYDGRVNFISYSDSPLKTDSMPVRARIGLNGLVTSSFAFLAMVGWGASFYEGEVTEDFDSVIGQLEAKFFLTPNPASEPANAALAISDVTVGVLRDFYDSYIGTYTERNRGYAKLSYFYSNKFLAAIDLGASLLRYPTIPELALGPTTDIALDASAFAEYRFATAFGVNATVRYDQYLSDTVIVSPPAGRDPLKYQEFQAFLGVRYVM